MDQPASAALTNSKDPFRDTDRPSTLQSPMLQEQHCLPVAKNAVVQTAKPALLPGCKAWLPLFLHPKEDNAEAKEYENIPSASSKGHSFALWTKAPPGSRSATSPSLPFPEAFDCNARIDRDKTPRSSPESQSTNRCPEHNKTRPAGDEKAPQLLRSSKPNDSQSPLPWPRGARIHARRRTRSWTESAPRTRCIVRNRRRGKIVLRQLGSHL